MCSTLWNQTGQKRRRSAGAKFRGLRMLSATLVARCATRYSSQVIQSFRHKGLQRLYESSSVAGIQREHAMRLRILLVALDAATNIGDMNVPGFNLYPVRPKTGKRRWSVWVAGNWRVTFEFSRRHAYVVDYEYPTDSDSELAAQADRRSRAAAAKRAGELERAGHSELARAFRAYAEGGAPDDHA